MPDLQSHFPFGSSIEKLLHEVQMFGVAASHVSQVLSHEMHFPFKSGFTPALQLQDPSLSRYASGPQEAQSLAPLSLQVKHCVSQLWKLHPPLATLTKFSGQMQLVPSEVELMIASSLQEVQLVGEGPEHLRHVKSHGLQVRSTVKK